MRKLILLLFLLFAFAIGVNAQSKAVTNKSFKMEGVWRLLKSEHSDGMINDLTNYKQMREYKILGADNSYYCIDIYYMADGEHYAPHEKATYSYTDGNYIENGRTTDMKIVDDRTFSMVWNHMTQYYQRVDLPLEEINFIKDIISNYEADKFAIPVRTITHFKGGDPMLYDFFQKNLVLKKIKDKNSDGVVFVQMVIGKDGTKRDIHIQKGLSPDADIEAMRVVNMMPDWVPAMDNGQAVDMTITLPIRF
jgi:hypothetical protein